jgi:Ca2+/Na+ antiporter
MDRRVPFFLIAAIVCVALVPVADPQHRWVAWTTAAIYVVLAFLLFLESRSRSRR